ncbi:MAG TPA: hypothetical protein VGL76_12255 [Gaiellaceae bacterium]|jgi:hypothetical protein
MRKLWAAGAVLALAALLAAPSGATTKAASGDTCTASGAGPAYALTITLPANATEQAGFAFGATGVKVMRIKDPGNPGKFSTQGLPANTTAVWLFSGTPAAVAGSQVTATVTMTRSISGSITVVPASATTNGAPMTFYDPIACTVVKGAPTPVTKFVVHGPFVYLKSQKLWQSYVSVPGPGRVNIGAKGSPKPLIHDRTYAARGAGKIRISLVPTNAGAAAMADGMIKLHLSVEFSPRGGRPLSKLVPLTLRT